LPRGVDGGLRGPRTIVRISRSALYGKQPCPATNGCDGLDPCPKSWSSPEPAAVSAAPPPGFTAGRAVGDA